jgi:hypothetical protein
VPRSQLTCREFVALIRRLREDELIDVDRRLFLQHRTICPRCAEYLKGYELTISAAKEIAQESNEAIPGTLVRRILGHR